MTRNTTKPTTVFASAGFLCLEGARPSAPHVRGYANLEASIISVRPAARGDVRPPNTRILAANHASFFTSFKPTHG